MGDTGSLALGGAIAAVALMVHKELLLPILCGVFVVETLSVIFQTGYFKYTRKRTGTGQRLFLMAPLHHHFEKKRLGRAQNRSSILDHRHSAGHIHHCNPETALMLQKNQHIVVIGAARSGVAAARLLHRNGYRVLLSDSGDINPSFRQLLEQDQIEFEQHGHSERAWNADCMVVSPGVPDTTPIVSNFLTKGKPVFSEVEAASWFCAAPMAAVTGSNGKTTVVTWLDHLWKTADKPHQTGGNIGKAFSDVAGLCTPDHWALLEVSSFQLDHIHRFQPRISCILNITPDHLDRYEHTFENYVSSKMRILENQTSDDLFVYWQDDVHVTARLNTMENGPRKWSFSASGPVNQGLFVDNGVLTWSF